MFDRSLVLQQLVDGGVVDALEVRARGFPERRKYAMGSGGNGGGGDMFLERPYIGPVPPPRTGEKPEILSDATWKSLTEPLPPEKAPGGFRGLTSGWWSAEQVAAVEKAEAEATAKGKAFADLPNEQV